MIYLDNAATTRQKPQTVVDAVCAALTTFGNSGRAAHDASLDASRLIYDTREKLAALFGCPRADHVCLTANSTEALNIALSGLFAPGDHILSTDCEHNSVLRPLYRLMEQGVAVDFVPADRQGNLDDKDFSRLLRPNTRALVCTHASNLTGNALDIERLGAFAHSHGLKFIVDASQTAGLLPIDMERQHIDVLCFTGHKSLYGPQGTGGLCVRPGVEIRPYSIGGTGVQTYLQTQPSVYPTRLEAGTRNGHGLAGLDAALDFLRETGIDRIRAHDLSLMRRFYDGVRQIPGVTVYGDFSQAERAPIVSLNIGGMESGEVEAALSEDYGIAVRSGAHCAPRLHEALGTKAQGAVRFSFGLFNTEDEIDEAVRAVKELAEE